MAKGPRLEVLDVADVPLREVSGLALRRDGRELLAVGDRDPVVLVTTTGSWPPVWHGVDLSRLDLPEGGTQFEAVVPAGDDTVLLLQEEPARVLHVDLATVSLLGTVLLEVPEGHELRTAWLADRSSRGESLVLLGDGHLLVVKEKDPTALLEMGPAGEAALGWQAGGVGVPPLPGDERLTALATWRLDDEASDALEDVSDATVGPDGRLYVLSDKSSCIARLAASLPAEGGTVGLDAVWRIQGSPENAEGLVVLDDGTPLVALDTRKGEKNLLRLARLPLA